MSTQRVSTTLTVEGEVLRLYITDCPSCGLAFGIPKTFEERRRSDGKNFYCPSGHSMTFGETEADRLRKRAERAEGDRDRIHADREYQREHRLAAERSNVALRGVVTRTKRRVGNGVCPCCQRTFSQLARHMASQHPEYASEPVPSLPASTRAIRSWARSEGLAVADKGRLPEHIVQAHRRAAEALA